MVLRLFLALVTDHLDAHTNLFEFRTQKFTNITLICDTRLACRIVLFLVWLVNSSNGMNCKNEYFFEFLLIHTLVSVHYCNSKRRPMDNFELVCMSLSLLSWLWGENFYGMQNNLMNSMFNPWRGCRKFDWKPKPCMSSDGFKLYSNNIPIVIPRVG